MFPNFDTSDAVRSEAPVFFCLFFRHVSSLGALETQHISSVERPTWKIASNVLPPRDQATAHMQFPVRAVHGTAWAARPVTHSTPFPVSLGSVQPLFQGYKAQNAAFIATVISLRAVRDLGNQFFQAAYLRARPTPNILIRTDTPIADLARVRIDRLNASFLTGGRQGATCYERLTPRRPRSALPPRELLLDEFEHLSLSQLS